MFARHFLRNAPPHSFFSSCREERIRRARCKKKEDARRGFPAPCPKLSPADNAQRTAPVRTLCSGCVTICAQRCTAQSFMLSSRGKMRGTIPVRSTAKRGAPVARPASIAATLVLPLDSPFARGVRRTLPLVAFFGVQRAVSYYSLIEIAKSFRQNLCHTALEPLTTSNETRFIPLSRLRRAGKAAYPLLPFSFQIQSLCFEFVRTSSEVSELSSRLTEARRYEACEDDIMLCGLRLVCRKFCLEIHLLILYYYSIKTRQSFRPELRQTSLSGLEIHKVFPAPAASSDTILPRKSLSTFYGIVVLLRNSIKTQLLIVILRNEVTKDLSFGGFRELPKKDPSPREAITA